MSGHTKTTPAAMSASPEQEAQASVEIAFKAAGETVDRRCGDHRRPEDFGERAVEDERGPVHEHKGTM